MNHLVSERKAKWAAGQRKSLGAEVARDLSAQVWGLQRDQTQHPCLEVWDSVRARSMFRADSPS